MLQYNKTHAVLPKSQTGQECIIQHNEYERIDLIPFSLNSDIQISTSPTTEAEMIKHD